METISIKDENGKEYEFEKPEFNYEFLKVVDDIIIGYVKTYYNEIIGGYWKDNGEFISGRANYKEWNLIQIKPKWYEDESNFPALITDGKRLEVATGFNSESQRFFYREYFYSNICNGWRLATKEEVLSLHYEGKDKK